MSRRPTASLGISSGFPRVSGDEPQTGQREAILTAFSPRERG